MTGSFHITDGKIVAELSRDGTSTRSQFVKELLKWCIKEAGTLNLTAWSDSQERDKMYAIRKRTDYLAGVIANSSNDKPVHLHRRELNALLWALGLIEMDKLIKTDA